MLVKVSTTVVSDERSFTNRLASGIGEPSASIAVIITFRVSPTYPVSSSTLSVGLLSSDGPPPAPASATTPANAVPVTLTSAVSVASPICVTMRPVPGPTARVKPVAGSTNRTFVASDAKVGRAFTIVSPLGSRVRTMSRNVSGTTLVVWFSLLTMMARAGRCRTSMRTLSEMPRSVQRTHVAPLARDWS